MIDTIIPREGKSLKHIFYIQSGESQRKIGTYDPEKIEITTYPARYFHSDSRYKNVPAIKVGFESVNSDAELLTHFTYIVSTEYTLPQAARIKETGDMILFGILERDPPLQNEFIEYEDLPNRESASVWTDITLIELIPLSSTDLAKLPSNLISMMEQQSTLITQHQILPEPEEIGNKNKIMKRIKRLKL